MKYVYLSYEDHSEDKEELIHMDYHYDVSLNFLKCPTFSADEEYKIEWNIFFFLNWESEQPPKTVWNCIAMSWQLP